MSGQDTQQQYRQKRYILLLLPSITLLNACISHPNPASIHSPSPIEHQKTNSIKRPSANPMSSVPAIAAKATCGDPPTENVAVWYPVFLDGANIADVHNRLCSDAIVKVNPKTGNASVQLASFRDFDRAHHFAATVGGHVGDRYTFDPRNGWITVSTSPNSLFSVAPTPEPAPRVAGSPKPTPSVSIPPIVVPTQSIPASSPEPTPRASIPPIVVPAQSIPASLNLSPSLQRPSSPNVSPSIALPVEPQPLAPSTAASVEAPASNDEKKLFLGDSTSYQPKFTSI
jgi:hypothetical protein